MNAWIAANPEAINYIAYLIASTLAGYHAARRLWGGMVLCIALAIATIALHFAILR